MLKKFFLFSRIAVITMGLGLWSRLAFAQSGAKNLKEVADEQIETARNLIDLIVEFLVKYSFQVLGGIIVLVIGWVVAGYIAGWVGKFLEKKKVDVTLSKFLMGAIKLIIMAFAVMVALGKFGIEIAPLIAGISVAGFGLSFALQGPLSNYAAGAALIFTKPFKVGDIIEVGGVDGEVVDMKLPRTELRALDGETIFIPNKHIVGEIIQNFSHVKRIDLTIGVSYSSDINKALDVVTKVIEQDPGVVKEKEPKIGISEFADSSINIYARLWCKQTEFFDVKFRINKKIFEAFQQHAIEIPFPQRDVNLKKE